MVQLKYIYQTRASEGTIRPDAAQEAVLPEFERIRTELDLPPPKKSFFGRRKAGPQIKGLYLWGGVGRGKSFVMDLFVAHVSVPKRRVHFHSFMQEIHAGMAEARKQGVEDALAPVAAQVANSVRLLAFDEMQITDITDAMIVGRLFEQLFEAGVVIVTTSNRHPDELYKNGLNRQLFLPFIEAIKENLVVWEMNGPRDYRQDRLSGEKVYFHPANADAKAAIDRLWQEMAGASRKAKAGGSEVRVAKVERGVESKSNESLTLTVLGREVVLPQFRNGVARVSFWDLCGQHLGPADFLAVAEAVKVLILEDVPRLGSSNFNEAKRFVTLVDALYEAGVKVIMSAADEPERLYLEGSGSFEFERTASRLREMQGEDWGTDAG